jgi:hypothetical protein
MGVWNKYGAVYDRGEAEAGDNVGTTAITQPDLRVGIRHLRKSFPASLLPLSLYRLTNTDTCTHHRLGR